MFKSYRYAISNFCAESFSPIQRKTTVINFEEQLRGRLARISEIKDRENQSAVYQLLTDTILVLSDFDVLQYAAQAHEICQSLIAKRNEFFLCTLFKKYLGILK